MLGGPLPPLPVPGVVYRRMQRLKAQASIAVHDQHLASRVLLRQFTAPIGQQGADQAYWVDLEHPQAPVRGHGLHSCGQAPVPDLVKF